MAGRGDLARRLRNLEAVALTTHQRERSRGGADFEAERGGWGEEATIPLVWQAVDVGDFIPARSVVLYRYQPDEDLAPSYNVYLPYVATYAKAVDVGYLAIPDPPAEWGTPLSGPSLDAPDTPGAPGTPKGA